MGALNRLGELCDVVGGADQRPLCLHGLKATQQELSKSSCLLDLPEHRLDDLLSQSVPAAITGALQLPPHCLRHLAADLKRGLGRMLGSPGGDIGVDLPGRERQKIVLAAIARIRPNLPRLASEVGPDASTRGTSCGQSLMLCVSPCATMICLAPSTAACSTL